MHGIVVAVLGFSLFVFSWTGSQASSHLPPPPPPQTGATPPPPPPPPPQQLKVYVAVNGQTFGPFNAEQLKARIAAGEFNRQTLVWMEGMAEWQPAATVAAVAPLLTAVPPEPKFDAAAFNVGTWETRGQMTLPDGTPVQVSETMTYRRDGSITGFGTMTAQGLYGHFAVNLSSKGTWKVDAKTDNSYILTLNLTVTATTSNAVPDIKTSTRSILLTVVDRNTVATPDGSRRFRVGN